MFTLCLWQMRALLWSAPLQTLKTKHCYTDSVPTILLAIAMPCAHSRWVLGQYYCWTPCPNKLWHRWKARWHYLHRPTKEQQSAVYVCVCICIYMYICTCMHVFIYAWINKDYLWDILYYHIQVSSDTLKAVILYLYTYRQWQYLKGFYFKILMILWNRIIGGYP